MPFSERGEEARYGGARGGGSVGGG